MWILRYFKEAIGSSLDYFSERVQGRFLSFSIQLVLTYLAAAIFTLLVTMIAMSVLSQRSFQINLSSASGMLEWLQIIDPVWVFTSVIAIGFFFQRDFSKKRMSFSDFYQQKTSKFWLELMFTALGLSIILIFYNRNVLLFAYAEPAPFELLLDEGLGNYESPFQQALSNWVFYILQALPIAAIVLIEVRERKRKYPELTFSTGKIILTAIVLGFIIFWTFDEFLFVFNELILKVITAPFEMLEIPAVFAVVVGVFFKTLNLMFFAAAIHFTIKAGTSGETSSIKRVDYSNDLLDN